MSLNARLSLSPSPLSFCLAPRTQLTWLPREKARVCTGASPPWREAVGAPLPQPVSRGGCDGNVAPWRLQGQGRGRDPMLPLGPGLSASGPHFLAWNTGLQGGGPQTTHPSGEPVQRGVVLAARGLARDVLSTRKQVPSGFSSKPSAGSGYHLFSQNAGNGGKRGHAWERGTWCVCPEARSMKKGAMGRVSASVGPS